MKRFGLVAWAHVAVVAVATFSAGCSRSQDPFSQMQIETLPVDDLVEGAEPEAPGVALAARTAGSIDPVVLAPALRIIGAATLSPSDAQTVAEVRSVLVHFDVIGAPVSTGVALEFAAPGEVVYERRGAELPLGPFQPQSLDFELPVAGTVIDLNGLSGAWAARLSIDGTDVAVQPFELAP